jgi:hypothetical protein
VENSGEFQIWIFTGADSAPTFLHELLGWDYGRVLEKAMRLFQATPDSNWVMEP